MSTKTREPESESETVAKSKVPTRPPGLKVLDKLVGRWKISGGSEGEVTYEWTDGGFFLFQRGEVKRDEGTYKYRGFIGYEHSPGAEPAKVITSRLYTSTGDTLDYTSEVDDKGMTIWFGPKGSPSAYKGEWSDDGNTLRGEWQWPGGGYKETMTRQKG